MNVYNVHTDLESSMKLIFLTLEVHLYGPKISYALGGSRVITPKKKEEYV